MLKYASRPIMNRLREHFEYLYGADRATRCMRRLEMMVGRYNVGYGHQRVYRYWDQADAILITYGDMIHSAHYDPLVALKRFLDENLRGAISTVHILPFFPYSSDDGFSVIDYCEVNPALGTWKDIEVLNENFSLMFDLVLNHVSRESEWFQDYVAGVAPARDYFIEMDPETDVQHVVRPRSLPLLTKTQTREGERYLWTTFSADQIDLDFSNPDVLFEFLDILFFYISKGARIIRMDAIAYLWKKVSTTCIHLPETHEVVKLFRDVLELVAPDVSILTETNVPHEENVSYFGDNDEAHIVYQFSLPPLLLHALVTGQSRYLTEWAATLTPPPEGCTYLNFTASHDGVGVRPLEGILNKAELKGLLAHVTEQGGQISTKRNSDGSDSAYELNITYFDALGLPSDEDQAVHINRFMCSQAVGLALQGIPAIYFNSVIGAQNDLEGVKQSGRARSINRQKWSEQHLEAMMHDKTSTHNIVFKQYTHLLNVRARHSAFSPDSPQRIYDLGPSVFVVERKSLQDDEIVVAISNFTGSSQEIMIGGQIESLQNGGHDVISSTDRVGRDGKLTLVPYETCWLISG